MEENRLNYFSAKQNFIKYWLMKKKILIDTYNMAKTAIVD